MAVISIDYGGLFSTLLRGYRMKTLKRTRYYTMNSWNGSTVPAYNLKVYNVIDNKLQDKVFELMECDGFYDEINWLMEDFNRQFDYRWQVDFNGRSGGYLVLYHGGKKDGHKSICTECGQCNFKTIEETRNNKCGKCGENARINKELPTIYSQPGMGIDEKDVPADVLKAFRKLAVDIVKSVKYMAKHCKAENETYMVEKTRKVIVEG